MKRFFVDGSCSLEGGTQRVDRTHVIVVISDIGCVQTDRRSVRGHEEDDQSCIWFLPPASFVEVMLRSTTSWCPPAAPPPHRKRNN